MFGIKPIEQTSEETPASYILSVYVEFCLSVALVPV